MIINVNNNPKTKVRNPMTELAVKENELLYFLGEFMLFWGASFVTTHQFHHLFFFATSRKSENVIGLFVNGYYEKFDIKSTTV